MKYILSYGGGINSSALYFYIRNKGLPLDLVIFADTGEELKTTYEAVKNMRLQCQKDNIKFVKCASDKGNLYNHYYDKKAVMSMMKRDCTGKFKVSPIRKTIRSLFGKKETFVMYIGISYDEFHRCRDSNVKYIKHSYPFVDNKITRLGNIAILKKHNFTASKSGCVGCMYNKRKTWINMLVNNPLEFERHLQLEENNTGFPKVLINGTYSLRSLKKAFQNQKSLGAFSDLESSCDTITGGCFL